MKELNASDQSLRVPTSLQEQLLQFRNRLWQSKMSEAIAMALAGCVMAFLMAYSFDRFLDTPPVFRSGLLLAAIGFVAAIPIVFYRWVWRYQTTDSLARLLGRQLPVVGDQLLGVLELARSEDEQARSPELCQAAMRQVATVANDCNFDSALPNSRLRHWLVVAGTTGLVAVFLGFKYHDAAVSSLTRLAMPWKDIPRYTFTRIEPLKQRWVVAHGEATKLEVRLSEHSRWRPQQATLQLGKSPPTQVEFVDDKYRFDLAPQIVQTDATLRIGDLIERLQITPTLRPELSKVMVSVQLPEYLNLKASQELDARSGHVAVVKGSRAVLKATANRALANSRINQHPKSPLGSSIISESFLVDESKNVLLQWQDHDGLSGSHPFEIALEATEDEAPTLICEGLTQRAVLLDSETLKFTVAAHDDFGIRRVGLTWREIDESTARPGGQGEKLLAAGTPDQNQLEALATFSAKSLGIEPQPIELMAWAEDYLPDRPRVYSVPFVLYILSPDQHAIWISQQLNKWHRRALDVRDREQRLHESNKQLQALPAAQLAQQDNRKKLRDQAAAERANSRRLAQLGELGEQLVLTASRNPEIGVGHLEQWAEMLQVLKDLAENRMLSVAMQLGRSADAPAQADAAPTKPITTPHAAPQLVDRESSANSPPDAKEPSTPSPPKKPNNPALRLLKTTVVGKGKSSDQQNSQQETQQSQLDQAVKDQTDLLAEFDKLSEEFNTILGNLEGSTLVKRLKAAARKQEAVATKLADELHSTFGRRRYDVAFSVQEKMEALRDDEQETATSVSHIMDDMSAFYQRRQMAKFKHTLDEMKSEDVLGSLRELATVLVTHQGMSIAQCEFWADTLDRWAENLVDPACQGCCPGGKSPESLPPSIVLEVLQILEAEVNLREETRVAEQAKSGLDADDYELEANKLGSTQKQVTERVQNVITRIGELPDAQQHFGKELGMLTQVQGVMTEATQILQRPETGMPAIAAETEAIELLLQSKRINPKSGGGGGASPGGGSHGTTTDSALALVGRGHNQNAVVEERPVTQSTGRSGRQLPEEYRSGLDQYFEKLSEFVQ